MTGRRPLTRLQRACAIDGCRLPHVARGWCDKHYRRWKAHGDPLGGRTLQGEPWRFYREVVLTCSSNFCLFWPYNRQSGGYAMLYRAEPRGHVYVHRLACAHKNGAAPTIYHEAAHSCGNGKLGCVNPHHLSWKTSKENHADKLRHGTLRRGTGHYAAKLTELDVRSIRALAGTMPQSQLGARFGVSQGTIRDILHRWTWAWLNE